jgi:hypothetical protein
MAAMQNVVRCQQLFVIRFRVALFNRLLAEVRERGKGLLFYLYSLTFSL